MEPKLKATLTLFAIAGALLVCRVIVSAGYGRLLFNVCGIALGVAIVWYMIYDFYSIGYDPEAKKKKKKEGEK